MYLDNLFLSASRSAIQLFLNLEDFQLQIEQSFASHSRFTSEFKVIPIQKNLKSFDHEDFSQLSHFLPPYLQSAQVGPHQVLKYIFEEFKDPKLFTEISVSKSFVKLKASTLTSTLLSEVIELNNKQSAFVEIVWDVSPTLGLVLNIFEKLEKASPLELLGMIVARGYFFSAFVKSKSSWKSFEDGRIHNWQGLVSGLLSGIAYPVILFLKSTGGQLSILQDIQKLKEFAKLQDSRTQIVWKDVFSSDTNHKTPEAENRSTYREFYKETKTREYEKPVSDNLRYRYNSTQPDGFYRQKTEDPGKLKIKDLEDIKVNNEDSKKYNTSKSLQMNFHVLDSDKGQMPEIKMIGLSSPCRQMHNSEGAISDYSEKLTRNYKTEPVLYSNGMQSMKGEPMYKQENLEYRKDFYRTAPQTYRAESQGRKVTETTKKVPIKENYQQKNEFPDTYRKVSESLTKETEMYRRGAESCKKVTEPQKKENQLFFPYSTASTIKAQESKFISSCSADSFKRESDGWNCPKCSNSNTESVYECSSCRFINWDRFYTIKAKNLPVRSGNVPTKQSDVYSRLYRTPPSGERDAEVIDYNGRSTAFELDFNRSKGYWDEDRKRTGTSFYFNQYN